MQLIDIVKAREAELDQCHSHIKDMEHKMKM